MSFNKPPPQKTSNKWPNDASVHRDSIYIDIQINKSGFSTQYHIPWHTQVTISFPPLHKTMHHSSPPQGCRKLGTQRPISHPLVPASHSPLDTSVTHKPRRPPLSIGPEPDTTPLKHQQELLTLKTTGLTILHTLVFQTTSSPPPATIVPKFKHWKNQG